MIRSATSDKPCASRGAERLIFGNRRASRFARGLHPLFGFYTRRNFSQFLRRGIERASEAKFWAPHPLEANKSKIHGAFRASNKEREQTNKNLARWCDLMMLRVI
jgi:hypothetical protein